MKMKKVIILIALAMFIFAANGQNSDAKKELKPLVDKYVKAWNTGNVDILDAIIDKNYERKMSPASRTAAVGLDGLKQVIIDTRTSFPDFHVDIIEEIYLKNKVITRYRFSGTNTGPGTIAPTGKKYTGTGISISNLKNGKVINEWAELDNLNTLLQLGYTITPPE